MIDFKKFNTNRLILSVPNHSYKPQIILSIIYCILFMVLGQILGKLIGQSLVVEQGTYSEAYNFMLFLVFGFGSVILLLFFWVKFIEKRPIRSLGFFPQLSFKSYFNGVLLGGISFSFIVLILFITGNATLAKPLNISITSLISILIVCLGWVIQGATEEILTRGWLFQVISTRYSVMWGAVISSVLFGLLHLANPNTNLLSTFNICIVGFFFVAYALYQESLWGVCGFHSVWNFVQGNFYGFQVSGAHAKGGSLFYFQETGDDFITGGAFGPEASIVTSIILIFLTIYYFKKALSH